MLTGKDFSKIEVTFFGLKCVEPNALIGDIVIFVLSLILAGYVHRLGKKHAFYKNWKHFFVVSGVSFLAGGLGHFFFSYWGVSGKYPGWFGSVLAVFFMERAMISIYPNRRGINLFGRIAFIKVILSWGVMLIMYSMTDLETDPQKGLLIPSLNSAVGMILCLGILARKYQVLWNVNFSYFWLSLFLMIPSALVQALKINFHPWFDRNDFSHLILVCSLVLYWKGIQAFAGFKSMKIVQ